MTDPEMFTILIVDDAPHYVAQTRAVLESAGYRVQTRAEVGDIVESVRDTGAALVVLGEFEPARDGLRAIREIARHPDTAGTPVVMVAVRAQAADKVRALWQGARAYLTKPVREAELLHTVNCLLGTHVRDVPPAAASGG